MRLSEKIDHMLRQYNYKRKRGYASSRPNNDFKMEEFLAEVDSYVDEIIEGIDKVLLKVKR